MEWYDPEREGRRLVAFAGTNDLIASIMGQTYVEFNLNQMLRLHTPDREHFDSMRLTFDQLLGLALSFAVIPAEIEGVLRQLAAIRNRFAHRIDHVLSDNEVAGALNSAPRNIKLNVSFNKDNRPGFMSMHAWNLRVLYINLHVILLVSQEAGLEGLPEDSKIDPSVITKTTREGFLAGATWQTVMEVRKLAMILRHPLP